MSNQIIKIDGNDINITQINQQDYICLTDICKGLGDDTLLYNWMRNRNTVEFLGIWEALNNPNFKGLEFETLRKEAGLNSFSLTPKKWIELTDAKGFISRPGKGGGTYAHKDIAFEFGSWLSPQFKMYLITEFQRLKSSESNSLNIEWNVRRVLSKANYQLHTQAIKDYRIPEEHISKEKEGIIYADEAEILNYAVFGFSSKAWREANPSLVLKGFNLRDVASINELAVMSNMESLNSIMLASHMPRKDRIQELRRLAQQQLSGLNKIDLDKSYKKLAQGDYVPLYPPKENNPISFGDAIKKISQAGKPSKEE